MWSQAPPAEGTIAAGLPREDIGTSRSRGSFQKRTRCQFGEEVDCSASLRLGRTIMGLAQTRRRGCLPGLKWVFDQRGQSCLPVHVCFALKATCQGFGGAG